MRRLDNRLSHEERVRLNLYSDVRAAGVDPSTFLEQLAVAVRERVWERLTDEAGQPLTFRRFLEAPYPVGIGTGVELIRKLVTLPHRREVLPAHVAAMRDLQRDLERLLLEPLGPRGGPRSRREQADVINRPSRSPGGTSREYLLRRLQRDAPDLAAQVLDGALSVHAAAVAAGIRKRATPLEAALRAWRHLTPEERATFLAEVTAEAEHRPGASQRSER